jgi:hypothetical protein
MQPDYSLITSPITSPECSLLEVECKQYLVASKRKFADALTDYANGRPNAQIVLVNYGAASDDILDEVDASVRNRTHVIGSMRPGSEPSQSAFAKLVKETVARRFAMVSPRSPIVVTPAMQHGAVAGEIVLLWGNFPNDLDLHMRIFEGGQPFEVSYSSMGSISNAPWAQLDHDIQRAHGQETIRISRWLDGPYRCAVHNYSGERQLADCGATVAVVFGKQELRFECPTSGTGVWWDVFSYSPTTGKFEIFNRITNSFY